MMTAPRRQLAAQLKPILPASWSIIDNAGSIDNIPGIVVQLIQRTITRLPQSPIGKHYVGFIAQISAPEQGMKNAEDRLDEEVDDFIHALDTLGVGWSNAEKVSLGGKRLAYQITLNVISSKEK